MGACRYLPPGVRSQPVSIIVTIPQRHACLLPSRILIKSPATPNNGSYLWQVPNGLCGVHSFSFGMNFQAINNYSPEFTIPCPSSSVWIPSTTYTGPSQQIATETIPGKPWSWSSEYPSTPTLECITSPGAGFELCVQWVQAPTPPPQTGMFCQFQVVITIANASQETTFLPLPASATAIMTGATTSPTFPVTAFSSGYFSSQLDISECPTSIYPSPTAFIDASGTTTSFLTAGCIASFNAPVDSTSGITDFGATCRGGQKTLSYNGIVTATNGEIDNEVICCPGNGEWYQTVLTKTSGDVRTAPPEAVEGYYCFSYLITLTYSPTTTISYTGSLYVDTGYPKRAVTTTTTASLQKRQDYPGFVSGFGAGATGTVVVINDVVFVRAATLSSSTSTPTPVVTSNSPTSTFSPPAVPHTVTAPAIGAYPIIAATTFAPGFFASVLAASSCPTSIAPAPTAVVGSDGTTTSLLTVGCATSASGASMKATTTCPAGLRPLAAEASGQSGVCCPSGAWLTTTIGASSTGAFCYSSIADLSSNGLVTALASLAEPILGQERRQVSSSATATGDVVVLNDVLFVKAVVLASMSSGTSSASGNVAGTATGSAAAASASAKSGGVARASIGGMLVVSFLLLCSLVIIGR